MYRTLVIIALGCASLLPASESDQPLTLRLPPTLEARQLAEVLAENAGIDLQFDPGRLSGTIRLALPSTVTALALWDAGNQALLSANLATVITDELPRYRILPIAEAAPAARVMLPGQLAALRHKPNFATVVIELKYLAAEPAVRALTTVLSSQSSQIRTLGQEARRLVISASLPLITQAESVLTILDRPGVAPAVRTFRPQRTAPQALQAAANAAWTATGRVAGQTTPVEFQIAPDGQQLLIVATTENVEEAQSLAARLDQAEPSETRSYRPAHFGLEDIAALLTQVLKDPHQPNQSPDIVRDRLTNRLVVTATAAQHARVAALLQELEQTPASARRRLQSLPVRHRPVEEMAKLLEIVLAQSSTPSSSTATRPDASSTTPASPATSTHCPSTPVEGNQRTQIGGNSPATPLAGPGGSGIASGADEVSIAIDPPTNRLILMGEPQQLEQIVQVVEKLDVHQAQVELQVVLATLSSSQNRELGVELYQQMKNGQTSAAAGSLFGVSTGTGASRTLPPTTSGLGAVVINPGDYAGVLRAIENVTNGSSLIRTNVVVVNNAKATISGVVQQPLTSINSGQNVATTAVSGTSDAGTQITISPQITAADQITLTYSFSQSSFIGASTTTSNGSVIPAPKRSDNLASIATIPDGHIITLGGLSSQTSTESQSRIPWIGSIPVLGWLFSSRNNEESNSRFYIFIRADVLRNSAFRDLRRLSAVRAGEMSIDSKWPLVKPQYTP